MTVERTVRRAILIAVAGLAVAGVANNGVPTDQDGPGRFFDTSEIDVPSAWSLNEPGWRI